MPADPRPLPPALVDWPAAVRGASAGFSVLVVGGLLAQLAALRWPTVGTVLLTLAPVLAALIAARRSRAAGHPALHGAVAAVGAYALVLPLILQTHAVRDVRQVLLAVATMIAVGALTGWIMGRRR